jgi:hypothetical protein
VTQTAGIDHFVDDIARGQERRDREHAVDARARHAVGVGGVQQRAEPPERDAGQPHRVVAAPARRRDHIGVQPLQHDALAEVADMCVRDDHVDRKPTLTHALHEALADDVGRHLLRAGQEHQQCARTARRRRAVLERRHRRAHRAQERAAGQRQRRCDKQTTTIAHHVQYPVLQRCAPVCQNWNSDTPRPTRVCRWL